MKRAWSGELNPLERDEFRREPGTTALANLLSEHDLPGGTATGTMLHEVLEKIPFDSLRKSSGFEDWIECKTVKDVFQSAFACNGITPTVRQRRQAERLIYRALTITLRLAADRSIPGLYQCQNVISELEFLFPFPEDNPPLPPESKPGKLVIEKGFIKGFVDLVVEHEGRVYFADWKSDILPSYETETITRHIELHYDTQVKLYSLALVKALRIENEFDYEKTIGGLFYVFLRALSHDQGDGESGSGRLFQAADVGRGLAVRGGTQTISTAERGRARMSGPVDLSPLGTAREAVLDANLASLPEGAAAADQALLTWYRKIREPLKALYNLEEEIVLIAWELSRWQDGLDLVERQAAMILILAVLIHLREGSTRIRLKGGPGPSVLLDLAARLLKGQDPPPPALRLEAVQAVKIIEKLVDSQRLGSIVGSAGEFKPLVVSGPYLYLQKMLHLEDRFVAVLRRRLGAAGPEYGEAAVEHALRDVLERPASRRGQAVNLTGEQEAAVRAAARHPMTIISGGPGTGKTTIILSILRVLRRLGVACADIALAAPTGKAANRMGEAVSAGIAPSLTRGPKISISSISPHREPCTGCSGTRKRPAITSIMRIIGWRSAWSLLTKAR